DTTEASSGNVRSGFQSGIPSRHASDSSVTAPCRAFSRSSRIDNGPTGTPSMPTNHSATSGRAEGRSAATALRAAATSALAAVPGRTIAVGSSSLESGGVELVRLGATTGRGIPLAEATACDGAARDGGARSEYALGGAVLSAGSAGGTSDAEATATISVSEI